MISKLFLYLILIKCNEMKLFLISDESIKKKKQEIEMIAWELDE